MKRTTVLSFVINMLIIASLACGLSAPSATPDIQATIEAAVVAQANTQATIEAAVAATNTAQAGTQATAEVVAQATNTAQAGTQATSVAAPTPIPPEEYVNMSEEELAALIDQAVNEAVTAAEQCSTATANATADDAVSQEEVQTVEVYLTGAEEAVALAEEMIYAYYELYGDLAVETLTLLQQVEQDLATITETTATITVLLQEVSTALEQGLALTEETISQLETAAQTASARAVEARTRADEWKTTLQAEREKRATNALAVQPNQVATDQVGAIRSAFDYVDAVRQSLTDGKISQAELANIAQLGANASASLNAHGGPQLQQHSGTINKITDQIARGRTPQARTELGNFENSLGARPSMPELPKPQIPSKPDMSKPGIPSRPTKP